MIHGFHKFVTPFLCLVLLGVLSGCSSAGAEAVILLAVLQDSPDSHGRRKNHYEPVILTSNENMVRIKYLSVGPNAEHEQVTQLIFDHCDGTYIETNRVELRGYTTVDAKCTHGTESLQ
jgi:hypothetical protein